LMPEAEIVLRKPRLGLGSGKLGTPLERMQRANNNCWDWLVSSDEPGPDRPDRPDGPGGVTVVVVEPDERDGPGEGAGWTAVVEADDRDAPDNKVVGLVAPTLATPGLFAPPVQAVARSATAASPAITSPGRRLRARYGFVPWSMVPPSGLTGSIRWSYTGLVVSGKFHGFKATSPMVGLGPVGGA
jgi:hypothetical protein